MRTTDSNRDARGMQDSRTLTSCCGQADLGASKVPRLHLCLEEGRGLVSQRPGNKAKTEGTAPNCRIRKQRGETKYENARELYRVNSRIDKERNAAFYDRYTELPKEHVCEGTFWDNF